MDYIASTSLFPFSYLPVALALCMAITFLLLKRKRVAAKVFQLVALAFGALLIGSALLVFIASITAQEARATAVVEELSLRYGLPLTEDDLTALAYPSQEPSQKTYSQPTVISTGDLATAGVLVTLAYEDGRIYLLTPDSRGRLRELPTAAIEEFPTAITPRF